MIFKDKSLVFQALWLITSIVGAFFLSLSIKKTNTGKVTAYIPPPPTLKYFTFGYSQVFADSLWLRWVQDIDVCGTQKMNRDQITPVPANTESETIKAAHEINVKNLTCPQGWSYRMLDAITELDPKFKLAYTLGAPALGILAHDPLGAEQIYEKGLKQFPEDWALYYRAGYHAQFELYEPEKAAARLNRAVELGAPDWLKSLAARLYSEAGQLDLAIGVLEGYLQGLSDPVAIAKVEQRIEDLKSRLNLRK